MCNSSRVLEALQEAARHQPPAGNEANPEKLSLALEPESAAIECQRLIKKAKMDSTYTITNENYLIIDCGGGIVDIATHSIVGGKVNELAPSAGNMQGGTTINERFRHFLSCFVGDPNFEEYLSTTDIAEKSCRIADLNKLIYTMFETQKINFGDEDRKDSYVIEFPIQFARHFGKKMEEKAESHENINIFIEEDGSQMRLTSDLMAKFFDPCLDEIATLIASHIEKYKLVRVIDTIFWVGGFGGSKHVRNQLQARLNRKFGRNRFVYICPSEPQLAVIRGATAFRCDPSVVHQRKSDATYGIECIIPFDRNKHNPKFQVVDDEIHSKSWCTKIFSTFVERNESICTNEVFVSNFVPTTSHQSEISLSLYSSIDSKPWYVTDDGVTKLATMNVPIAGVGRDREIEVIFDITHTEIQVCARDKQSQEEYKIIVDFLGASK